jgi:16S rRNA processing protein RimM
LRYSSENLAGVVIAKVLRTRGTRGQLVCQIETDLPERLSSLKEVRVRMVDQTELVLKVEGCSFHKGRAVLKFKGYDNPDAAAKLIGASLVIPEPDPSELEEGTFYEYQLIGSQVITLDGRRLGQVQSIMRTGGTDLLVVRGEGEHLIPFADHICPEVDPKAKLIRVNPPEGLLDL